MVNEDALGVDALLLLDDPPLNHRFNGGNLAYCDERFEDFKKRLPHFEQELKSTRMKGLRGLRHNAIVVFRGETTNHGRTSATTEAASPTMVVMAKVWFIRHFE